MEYLELAKLLENMPKEKFRQTANKLLNECFLLKACEDTKKSYYVVLNNKELFALFFDLLGYEINIMEEFGMIALSNSFGTGRVRLTRTESILLLLLRLIYIEQTQKLSQTDDVIICIDDLYERYKMLKLKRVLGKTQMRTCLAKLKKYHLIHNIQGDMGNPDTNIQIYPSITLAVRACDLDELYQAAQQKMNTYLEGGETDDSDGESD